MVFLAGCRVKFIQAKHGYFNGTNRPRWIVIHDAEYPESAGAAEWIAQYFASTNEGKSAHYSVDADEAVQSVQEEDGAWHTPGFADGVEVNRASIGIEHAGYASQSQGAWIDPYSRKMLERSAALVAEIAKRWDIPLKHLTVNEIRAGEPGIAGHVDFTRATGSGSHVDPGPNFPWDWYMGKVKANSSGGTKTFIGLIGLGLVGYGVYELIKKL